jgi:hypothetical protein
MGSVIHAQCAAAYSTVLSRRPMVAPARCCPRLAAVRVSLLLGLLVAYGATAQTVAGSGFPGDTFTVHNLSYGVITSSSLSVTPNVGTVTSIAAGWTWSTPTWASPGEYQLTITVSGPEGSDVLTRSVWLCTESAALGISADLPSYLVGEQATLSGGGSQGHPSSFDFVVPAGVTASGATTGVAPPGNLGVTFSSCGTYTMRTVARYEHAGTDIGCGAWYTDSRPTLHDACAELSPRVVAPARATFLVKQNGTVTSQPLVTAETVLEFTGKVAPGYTPAFAWSYPGVTGCQYINAAGGYTGSTCRIAAGTLTPGQPVALSLTVQLSPAPPSGCAGSVTSATTTLNPYAATAGFQLSPVTAVVGQTVSMVLEGLSGNFANLRYGLGGATCAPAQPASRSRRSSAATPTATPSTSSWPPPAPGPSLCMGRRPAAAPS